MPRISHDSTNFSVGARYFWARIETINYTDDEANVVQVDEFRDDVIDPDTGDLIRFENCPIFFHCNPEAELSSNGSLKGGAAAFTANDIVYCRKREGEGYYYKVFVIANSQLRGCDPTGLIVTTVAGLYYIDPLTFNPSPEYFRQSLYIRWLGNNTKQSLVQRSVGELYIDAPCTVRDGLVNKWAFEESKRRIEIPVDNFNDFFCYSYSSNNINVIDDFCPVPSADTLHGISGSGSFVWGFGTYYKENYALIFDKMFDIVGLLSDDRGFRDTPFLIDSSDDDEETSALTFDINWKGIGVGVPAMTPDESFIGNDRLKEWINRERTNLYFIPELEVDSDLETVAQTYASYCAGIKCIGHYCDGHDIDYRVSSYFETYYAVAENVVAVAQTDPPLGSNQIIDEMFLGWKDSELHYSSIIDPRFTIMGFGYSFNPGWGEFGTFIGVLVLMRKVCKGTSTYGIHTVYPSYEGSRTPDPAPIDVTTISPITSISLHPNKLSELIGWENTEGPYYRMEKITLQEKYKAISALNHNPNDAVVYLLNHEVISVERDTPGDPDLEWFGIDDDDLILLSLYASDASLSSDSFIIDASELDGARVSFAELNDYSEKYFFVSFSRSPALNLTPRDPDSIQSDHPYTSDDGISDFPTEGKTFIEYHPSGGTYVTHGWGYPPSGGDHYNNIKQSLYVDGTLIDEMPEPSDFGFGAIYGEEYGETLEAWVRAFNAISPMSIARSCSTEWKAVLYIKAIAEFDHNDGSHLYFQSTQTLHLAILNGSSVMDIIDLDIYDVEALVGEGQPCSSGSPTTIEFRANNYQENFSFCFDGCISNIQITYVSPFDGLEYTYAWDDLEDGVLLIATKFKHEYMGRVELNFAGGHQPTGYVRCTADVGIRSVYPRKPYEFRFNWEYESDYAFYTSVEDNSFLLHASVSMSEDGQYIAVTTSPAKHSLTDPDNWGVSIVQFFYNNSGTLVELTDPMIMSLMILSEVEQVGIIN